MCKISLGFWHNFGADAPYERSRAITHYAFDHGITHFDFANNYGVPYGSAELTMGRLMTDDYLNGIPADSRMAKEHFLKSERRTPELLDYLHELQAQAQAHGRSIAQEALSWVLDQAGVTSVLVGASSVEQLANNCKI